MLTPYADVCCASLTPECLPALAELRAVPGVTVLCLPERLWVRWQAGAERVLQCVQALPDAILYSYRDPHWYRLGAHLPTFDMPDARAYTPLHQVVFPAPVQPIGPGASDWAKANLSLHPDTLARATTAMICQLSQLSAWADTVPSCRLHDLRGARNGANILVIGERLPLVPDAQRLWGTSILLPLRFRLEPDLPEALVRGCLNLGEDEILLVLSAGMEVVRRADLTPLNRARLHAGEP
ncbi:MAG TPA: hypothetical protein VFE62_24860 [Gemmataceae bacterium]|nr:hypothetical protein [Gemmataceae bacterium]